MFNIDQFERLFKDYSVVQAARSRRFVAEKRGALVPDRR
jgi:hypothetical protein